MEAEGGPEPAPRTAGELPGEPCTGCVLHPEGNRLEEALALTGHERTALALLDFGFMLPQFAGAWEGLAARGLAEPRDGAPWHVTGLGRAAYQGVRPDAGSLRAAAQRKARRRAGGGT
jgi:hypothetical protein